MENLFRKGHQFELDSMPVDSRHKSVGFNASRFYNGEKSLVDLI